MRRPDGEQLPAERPPNTGICAPEYNAAMDGVSGTLYTAFFDPATPLGIANQLAVCDTDGMCASACGVRLAR